MLYLSVVLYRYVKAEKIYRQAVRTGKIRSMEIPLCISPIITEPMVFFCHRMILMPEIPYSEKEMDNVIKYAKENTDVHAQPKKDGHVIHMIITNISESELSEHDLYHLFDRFYRPDASCNSSTGGSGLGLAMAKAIVQTHKGTIKAEMHDHALTIHIALSTH